MKNKTIIEQKFKLNNCVGLIVYSQVVAVFQIGFSIVYKSNEIEKITIIRIINKFIQDMQDEYGQLAVIEINPRIFAEILSNIKEDSEN